MSESSTQSSLPVERSLYIGIVIGGILYGILLFNAILSWYLLTTVQTDVKRRARNIYISYGFIFLFLATLEFSANALMGQMMWLEHRDFPGGPTAYYLANNNIWWNLWHSACIMISIAMSDALLLYRCYIIWGKKWVVLFPAVISVASIIMGIISLVQVALPNSSFFAIQATTFAIPWIALSSAFNVLVTALIISRILYVSHINKKASGSSYTFKYIGVVTLLVESALPSSVTGVAFAVCISKNWSPLTAMAIIWGAFVALGPQFIILRVAMGRAWGTGAHRSNGGTAAIEFALRGIKSSTGAGAVTVHRLQHDNETAAIVNNESQRSFRPVHDSD